MKNFILSKFGGFEDFQKQIIFRILNILIGINFIYLLIFIILSITFSLNHICILISFLYILFLGSMIFFLKKDQNRLVKSLVVLFSCVFNFLLIVITGGIHSPFLFSLLIPIFVGIVYYGWQVGISITVMFLIVGLVVTLLFEPIRALSIIEEVVIRIGSFISISFFFGSSFLFVNQEYVSKQKANEALIESEKKWRNFIHNLPIGAMIANFSGEINLINAQLENLLGYSKHNFSSTDDWYKLVYPDEKARIKAFEFWKKHAIDEVNPRMNREAVMKNRKGEKIYTESWANLVKDEVIVLINDISHRKTAEEQIKKKINQLSTLRVLDQSILNSERLQELLSEFFDQILDELSMDAVWFILFDQEIEDFIGDFSKGFGEKPEFNNIPPGLIFSRHDTQIQSIFLYDEEIIKLLGSQISEFNFCSLSPVSSKEKKLGYLGLFNREPFTPDNDWMNFEELLTGQFAIGIERLNLIENLKLSNQSLIEAYDTTLQGWANALELRDKETEGHSRRVVDLTIEIAHEMGLPKNDLIDIYRGALLHDIGKMGIPDEILLKEGKLNENEWDVMREHTNIAYNLLKGIPFLQNALDIPYSHHERWDGTGYPQGLKEEEIPISARIFAIVDVWDALRSDRPYRKAWSQERTLEYIIANSGSHFDPSIVKIFTSIIKK